jgi:translation elongation factor P/translation initiation factor 5A
MVTASQLRAGMAIRFEGEIYKVLMAEYHSGQGKMGGANHIRLDVQSLKYVDRARGAMK